MKLAVIRIRGEQKIRGDIRDTLTMLRLFRKNYCVILNDTPSNRGMVNKAKDMVTFGLITEELEQEIYEKKGEEYKGREKSKNESITYKKWKDWNGKKIKPYFRLTNPVGGFERKGIKKPFSEGGVLGDRGESIQILLKKMIQ